MITFEINAQLAYNWHYLTVIRNKSLLKAYFNDIFFKELEVFDASLLLVKFVYFFLFFLNIFLRFQIIMD